VARKKEKGDEPDEVIDVASRLGMEPRPPSTDTPERLDAPIPSAPRTPLGHRRGPTDEDAAGSPIPAQREAPRTGEVDLLVTPLPTPDDWHRFELALRKVRGISQLQPEYYRHGVLKLRVSYSGPGRLAYALRDMPGYRVRVIGEDRSTLQILVTEDSEERRPG
jgi:hypothetical protein